MYISTGEYIYIDTAIQAYLCIGGSSPAIYKNMKIYAFMYRYIFPLIYRHDYINT